MARAQSTALPLELHALLNLLGSAEVADDQQWVLALMRKDGLTIINLLWRMLGAEADVLDVYQTVVCRLTARGQRATGPNPSGYFYRAAMNTAIEALRARKRRRQHGPAIRDVQKHRYAERAEAGSFDQREALAQMRQAICLLPPYLRSVIILRDLAELSYAQVSRILGIQANTARLYRRQAVVRLADLIGREANP